MRYAELERKTSETEISVKINLDGEGISKISTEIPFVDHMLNSFSKHSGINLELIASGDIEIDFHHTIEDIGITLGEAFNRSLGDKKGIERFGDATVPLDEALVRVAIDISGRPYLHFGLTFDRYDDGNGINPYLFEEFFRGFVNNAKITLHIDKIRGDNSHHILESCFKAFAKAIKKAISISNSGIPSTKGII